MTATEAPRPLQEWSQVPGPDPARTDLATVPRELVALVVMGLGPVARSVSLVEGRPVVVAAVVVSAAALQWVLGSGRWALRLLVALAAGVAVGAVDGFRMGIWVLAGALLADWVVRRRRPLPGVPAPPLPTVLPIVVLAVVAAVLGRDPFPTLRPLLPMAIALAVAGLSAFRPDAVASAAAAFGAFVGRLMSALLFGAIGLVVVVAPWVVNRLARVDPLRRRSEEVLRAPVGHAPVDPRRSWKSEPFTEAVGVRWRRRLVSWSLALGVVGVGVLAVFVIRPGPAPPSTLPTPAAGRPAAFADSPWWNEYDQDINWIMQESTVWSPWTSPRVSDVRTRHVNVVDGARVSWSPPPCESCPRRSLWIYGGSTGFGFGQRDEGTIASWLARTAWKEGIALDVSNRGTPGDLHWQEANRLAWDLLRDPAPDVVVFYDGVNELWSGEILRDRKVGDVREPIHVFAEGHRAGVRKVPTEVPRGASIPPEPKVVHPDVEFTADVAVRRYERSLELSRMTLDADQIPGLWFWQPSRYSRPAVEGEPVNPDGEAKQRRFYMAAAEMVPGEVVNLTSVFDGVVGPLFSDDVHHNERAARIIAEAMWPDVRRTLGLG